MEYCIFSESAPRKKAPSPPAAPAASALNEPNSQSYAIPHGKKYVFRFLKAPPHLHPHSTSLKTALTALAKAAPPVPEIPDRKSVV